MDNQIGNRSNRGSIQSEQPDEKVKVYFDGEELEVVNIHVMAASEINEHVKVRVTAEVNADIYDMHVQRATSKTQIKVEHTIKGETSFLFEGLLIDIEAEAEGAGKENSVYFLSFLSYSHTCELDVLHKYKSFQDEEMTFDELFSKIIEDYPKAQFINNALPGVPIQHWILQFNVTDWVLIIQQASKAEAGLYPDASQPFAQFQVGVPKGKNRGTLEQYDYKVCKKLYEFQEYDKNEFEHETTEFDFMEYTIKDEYAKDTFMLGDQVTYNDISLYVAHVESEIKDNKLYNTYTLKTQNGLKMPRLANEEIQGLSIPGKVIDVQDNHLKLHLEIDEEQPIDEAKWFDYATFYATWYGMPEINDIVNLHFPTVDERDAVGLNSHKQNPDGGYTRNNEVKTPENTSASGNQGPIDFVTSASDPDVKLLATKPGRMIELGPDRICIQYSDGTYTIYDDSNGAIIYTTRDIAMYAEKMVNIDAKDWVHVQAKNLISLQSNSSLVEITPSKVTVRSAEKKIN